jgi:hypothetical protein
MTPPTKQVMMFTATLQDEMRKTCKRFMNEVRPSARGVQHQRAPDTCAASQGAAAAPSPSTRLLPKQSLGQLLWRPHSKIVQLVQCSRSEPAQSSNVHNQFCSPGASLVHAS